MLYTLDMATLKVDSTWIESLQYVRSVPGVEMPEGATGFLVVRTKRGDRYAYATPPWVIGLMAAAKSKGRMFSRLVKGRPSIKLN